MSGRLQRFSSALEGLERKGRRRRLEPRRGRRLRLQRLSRPRGVAPARRRGSGSDRTRRARRRRRLATVARQSSGARGAGGGGRQLLRTERALFFGAGFSANVALIQTLPQRGDLVVHDELIHASVRDGLRGCRAEVASARHNDPQAVEDAVSAWRARGGLGAPWIATESLFSMDGDRAPVADLIGIAERHDGFLLLDEAHATGVLGASGRGIGEAFEGRDRLISTHTCGKALGVSGALVTGPAAVIDYLVNRARPFIYATAPSPLVAAAVREALRIVAGEPERRAQLAGLVAIADRKLAALGLAGSGSQIQPVILGQNARAVAAARRLRAAGFDCRAIRPPTVPEGTARLRVSLTLNVTAATVENLFDAIGADLSEAAA